MTTLLLPSFERQLLQTVREEVTAGRAHGWPQQKLQLSLDLLRLLREQTTRERQILEVILAHGVEARSFVRNCSPLLATTEDHLAKARDLVEWLSLTEDAASQSLAAESRLLEQETQAVRNLLAEALARASEPPRPVDWDRVRASEEAHARGETKPFARR
jgi:hypothetical protein